MMHTPQPAIYFLRHGETDWNAVARLQGNIDIPINAKGEGQAAACGRILHGLMAEKGHTPKDYFYVSSPLRRATATMDIVRPVLGLPATGYVLDDRLREIAYGDWEGLTLPQTQQRDPVVFAQRERDKWNTVPPSGESYAALAARVADWHRTVTADTVVTAHGGVLRALMVLCGFVSPADAADMKIEQGVVYAFVQGTLNKYGSPVQTA